MDKKEILIEALFDRLVDAKIQIRQNDNSSILAMYRTKLDKAKAYAEEQKKENTELSERIEALKAKLEEKYENHDEGIVKEIESLNASLAVEKATVISLQEENKKLIEVRNEYERNCKGLEEKLKASASTDGTELSSLRTELLNTKKSRIIYKRMVDYAYCQGMTFPSQVELAKTDWEAERNKIKKDKAKNVKEGARTQKKEETKATDPNEHKVYYRVNEMGSAITYCPHGIEFTRGKVARVGNGGCVSRCAFFVEKNQSENYVVCCKQDINTK